VAIGTEEIGAASITRVVGCACTGCAAGGAATGLAIGFPHLLQNEAMSGLDAPQKLQNIGA